MKKETEIRAIIIEPGKEPREETIPNTLEAFQEIVGGYIEAVELYGKDRIIINEEGKLNDLPYNVIATEIFQNATHSTDYIVGTAIIAATRVRTLQALTALLQNYIYEGHSKRRLV